MKKLTKTLAELKSAGRWDIDFHSPAEGIQAFPRELWKRVDEVADVVKDKRDPTKKPDEVFQYIDISAVDVSVGVVVNPQELEGVEAPSRARKVVRAFDLIISTCRPTRGAIAVVPVRLHNQVASTGFSIMRAHKNINPFYLHYALRLPSTLEQFRKWSTGSSYPAILDSDVEKTVIPVPSQEMQDVIAARVMTALRERAKIMEKSNEVWRATLGEIADSLSIGGHVQSPHEELEEAVEELEVLSLAEVQQILKSLPEISTDKNNHASEEPQESLELG